MRYLLLLFVVLGVLIGCGDSKKMRKKEKQEEITNKIEGYKPSEPISFSHEIHSGEMGIDCKYCHNSVSKSKTAGIPSVNVCMNCHKQIPGEDDDSKKKIQKVYDAAGWNGEKFTGEQKPIVWNKVHNLPDSVYLNKNFPDGTSAHSFSHAKHVQAGSLDCASCHGDLKKQEVTSIKFDENFCLKCHY